MGEDGGAPALAGGYRPPQANPQDEPQAKPQDESRATTAADAPAPAPAPASRDGRPSLHLGDRMPKKASSTSSRTIEDDIFVSTAPTTPNPFGTQAGSFDINDYFSGPRDIGKHSKWPLFLQMHGSIVPKLIVPLIFVGLWATLITVISKKVHNRT